MQEYFQLRINGSEYRVQRVESIINISFAAAALLYKGAEKSSSSSSSSKTYVNYTFDPLHSVFTTIYSQLEKLLQSL